MNDTLMMISAIAAGLATGGLAIAAGFGLAKIQEKFEPRRPKGWDS